MIYKVLYQESSKEAPRREHTKTMFVEADAISAVRKHISENKPYMIEYIQEMNDKSLEYERENNPDFEVENI